VLLRDPLCVGVHIPTYHGARHAGRGPRYCILLCLSGDAPASLRVDGVNREGRNAPHEGQSS
jgi:hypothetical protein